MTRGLSLIQHRRIIVLRSFLILIAMAGFAGCIPSPTKEPSAPIVCTPESPKVNIYKTVPQTWTNSIIQYGATPIAPNTTPQEKQILEARYAALQYLIYETERWSDSETIKLDDASEAQIVITFLGPELIQAIFLNEFLEHSLFYSDFESQTQAALNSIAARDELLFFVTVTTTNNDTAYTIPHIIDIPIKKTVMTNAADLEITPSHDDHILDQPINSSSKPVFGYLAYPLAIMHENNCNWILDSKYSTSIVLSVSGIEVDKVIKGPYTWSIEYLPMVTANLPSATPAFIVPPGFDPNQLLPLSNPPKPVTNLVSSNEAEQDIYWQSMARFIWNQITLGNY